MTPAARPGSPTAGWCCWPIRTARCGTASASRPAVACWTGRWPCTRHGPYVVQAAIAALHTDPAPDWAEIAALYGKLSQLTGSPVVELNRAIAVAEHDGPQAGLEILDRLDLHDLHYLHAARGELLRRCGRVAEARDAYARALALVVQEPERRLLERLPAGVVAWPMALTNWGGNYRYRATAVHRPASLEELQEIVARAARIRVLGSRHSFTDIGDATELVSLDAELPGEVVLDADGAHGHRRRRHALRRSRRRAAPPGLGPGQPRLAAAHLGRRARWPPRRMARARATGTSPPRWRGLALVRSDGELVSAAPRRPGLCRRGGRTSVRSAR